MNNFSQVVAYKTLNLLAERKALIYPEGTAFYIWPAQNRLVIVFDADEINLQRVDDTFAHGLSTRLNGRRVKRTNSRGVFLQVGYDIPPAPLEMIEKPLKLSEQPSPFHLPVGSTGEGDLWISLTDGDSFLIGGTRNFGKTGLLHGWIQSLLYGKQTEVYAWDGKDGMEYLRYTAHPRFHLMANLSSDLQALRASLGERRKLLTTSGHPNIIAYNQEHPNDPLPPIALVLDEVALIEEYHAEALSSVRVLVERERAVGVFPILATNRPDQASVFVKGNLGTRICFPVPSHNESGKVLGRTGAERLPKKAGRGLILWKARMLEFQAFQVIYPKPTAEQTKNFMERQKIAEPQSMSEIEKLAASIRDQWTPELSKRKTAELLGKTYAGAFAVKVDQVIQFLTATTTTKSVPKTDLNVN